MRLTIYSCLVDLYELLILEDEHERYESVKNERRSCETSHDVHEPRVHGDALEKQRSAFQAFQFLLEPSPEAVVQRREILAVYQVTKHLIQIFISFLLCK